MEKFNGKSIYNGIAIGKILYYSKNQQQVKRSKIENTEKEWERYLDARKTATKQLSELHDKALLEVGEVNAQIFEVHAMMLEDVDYNDCIHNMITQQMVNAEFAVASAGDNFSEMFSNMEDEYFRARASDVKDISERVVNILSGSNTNSNLGEEPVIVVADDLAPSETVQMDKSKLLAFVTKLGSSNSHTAILARTMNIPALIGVDIDRAWNGKMGILDGYSGTFYIDPADEIMEIMKERQKEDIEKKELLLKLKGLENVTRSGKHIKLYANIGNVSDLALVLQNDASGIGLFRSEFLYLGSNDYPTEEEQFTVYRQVAKTMGDKMVIIRTLDIGADKQADYFNMEHEENPAMGYRAIRICLDRQDIFKTQLRAIFRASAFGNVAIMYPMIISVEEVRQIKNIVNEVKSELDQMGIQYGNVSQGIMIETPAAVMISDLLAKEVDFFSIGTNDLTQYTLAIDRQNARLDRFYNSHHEGVLRMIRMVVENAHKEGIWAGICGELAADMELTDAFLDMGVDELSVSPSFILPIRKVIREH